MPIPAPSELSAVTLLRCLPLLLLFFLTTPSATTLAPDIHLPPLTITESTLITHVIPRTASIHQQISLPKNTTALIETFYNSPPPYPHPLLLVSPYGIPPLILTPREAPPGLHADYEAFWTRRPYAYLLITNRTRLYIRVYEHHDTFAHALNATLRITVVPPGTCPRGPGGEACSGRGACRAGECVCHHGFAGRYCEASVEAISEDPFTVPFEQMVYYKYPVLMNGSVAVKMLVQREEHTGNPVVFAKRAYENGGTELLTGPPLPTVYDVRFGGRVGVMPVQTIVSDGLKRGDILYIGVCNLPRPIFLDRRYHELTGLLATAPVTVQLRAFPCANRKVDGLRRCPAAAHESWELSLTFLLLPLLLGTLTLLTMVVCVSVWAGVFRQQIFEVIHGHAQDEALPRRDKLSEAEVNAMFPAFTFTKGETAALGATGDVCCSVCLCSFEEGELLRRLACGHSYHSICLDRWLLTNATCPRCRKSARIHGEIGRLWLLRRHMVRVIARANGFLHWLVGFSQPRVRESPELESVEVEGLIPNREDGVSRRYVQTS